MTKQKYIWHTMDLLSFIFILLNMIKYYGINKDAFCGYLIALCWFIGFLLIKIINQNNGNNRKV